MPVPDIDGTDNVKRVYISDSPVLDDHVQYNYVSSDIEEDDSETPRKLVTDHRPTLAPDHRPTPAPDHRPTPAPDHRPTLAPDQVDVTAVAGDLDDTLRTEEELDDEDELAMEAEYQRQLQERLQNATLKDDRSESVTPVLSNPDAAPSVSGGKSLLSRDQTHTIDESAEWGNPPPNPFSDQSPEPARENTITNNEITQLEPQLEETTADPSRFEDMNIKTQEEKFVPENFSKPAQPVPQPRRRQLPESLSKPPDTQPAVQPNPFISQQNPTHFPTPQQHTRDYQQQTQPDYTYAQQKPHPTTNEYNNVYQYYNQPQPQQLPPQQQYYNTHTQNPYHNNPNFTLEQFASYQPQREEPAPQGMIGLQRNAPVMYLNTAQQNEYQVATPREIHHPYVPVQQTYPPGQTYRQEDEQSEVASESSYVELETNRSNKARLPPKPQKPQKNFLQKNKGRVKGQMSAKLGYGDKLVQRRIEQEQINEWAPGMVLPRKKAASADDIIRAESGYTSPEDVWTKRSKELAIAKKSSGNRKSKKLPRYPSDSNLVHKATPKIPPINPKGGYVTQFQQQQTYYNQSQTQTQPTEHPGYRQSEQPTYRQAPEQTGYRQEQPHPGFRQSELPVQSYANNFQQQQQQRQTFQQPQPPAFQQPQPQTFQQPQPPSFQQPQRQAFQQPQPQAFQQPQPQHQVYSPTVEQYSQPVPQTYFQTQPPPHSYQTSPTHPASGGYAQGYPASGGYAQSHPPRQPDKQVSTQPPQGYQPEYPAYDYSGYEDQHTEKSAAVNGMYSSPSVDSYFQPYKPSKPTINPYAAVPPIKPESQSSGAGGSYIQAYQDQKEKSERAKNPPQYKVYTMKDYKKLKLEYKLGGLGPSQDPAEIREKNEIRIKQLQYAKEAMEHEKKKPVVVSPRKEKSPPVQQISSRQLMVEYARNNIPKPAQPQTKPTSQSPTQKPTSNNSTIPAMNPLSSPNKQSSQPALKRINDTEELDEMTRRHEEESRIMNEVQYQLEQTA